MHSRWDQERFRALLGDAMSRAGLSQREVADLVGVSHSQISRWMAGTHRPTHDNITAAGDGLRARCPELGDITGALLSAAGYIDDSDLGPAPHYDDPAEMAVSEEVWRANARLDDDVRRGFVELAVRMRRERIKKENEAGNVRRLRRA